MYMRVISAMKVLVLLFLLGNQLHLHAQSKQSEFILKDSLLHLGFKMYNEPNEPERLQANYAFIKTLVQLLKEEHSFDQNLDTLQMISIRKSPDNFFRLFSWHLPLADGSYRYYGAIQLKTADGSLDLKPLVDQSHIMERPEHAVTDNNHWYGAQYYEVIPLKGLNHHYLLLGWKGYSSEITYKTIDIIHVNSSEISFGKTLFSGRDVDSKATRMIYKYNAGASMLLKYEKQPNRIVMDHLAPAQPSLNGQFKYYGPDMSYDAWKIENKQLVLVEDLPLKND